MSSHDRAVRATALAALMVGSLVITGLPAAARDVPLPRFVDETATSGLEHVNDYQVTPDSPTGGWQFVVGGGLAVLDCDADGRPDLYLAGGSSPASLYRNESEAGGALRFTRVDAPAVELVHVSGAYPLDVDSDGLADLAVLRLGENVVLRGLGDCRFEVANAELGLDGGDDWSTAFSATWEPGYAPPATGYQSRSRRGIAPCRSSSATGTARVGGTCASATTASSTDRRGRSSCGATDLGHGHRRPRRHR